MATRTVDLGPVIGPQGPKGDAGQGVPAGGAAGQILVKVDATNFNTVWKSLIDAGIFKADGSVPMTGNFNMQYHDILDVENLRSTGDLSAVNISATDNDYVIFKHPIQFNANDTILFRSYQSDGYTRIEGDVSGNVYVCASGNLYLESSLGEISCGGGVVTNVGAPIANADATPKGYVDSKVLVFTGKTVTVASWVSNTTYSAQGYNWRAAVACAGVSVNHRPDVAFGAADAVSGNFAPIADSYAGGVYIYCKAKPTATITIPSIVCVRGA